MESIEELTKRRDSLRQSIDNLQYCDRLTRQQCMDRESWTKELAQVERKLREMGVKL